MAKSSLWQELSDRGLLSQSTGQIELEAMWAQGPITFYLGVDPTGDSLHVGHLTPLMLMRHLSDAGHRPVVIVGGGTAMVGDPTGKTQMRPMLDAQQIAVNAQRIQAQISAVLKDRRGLEVVNNADHLLELNYITFLREVGRHFSVNRMLTAESVQLRLQSSLSFIEFNYPLLQAYDYLVLRRQRDCRLQIGGDDQWGNILAGVDLVRRADGERVEGLTVPLLTTATGAKMGKTAQGAVWLAADKCTPNDFYQFWVNTSDADVLRFLRIYTLLPLHELKDIDVGDVVVCGHAKQLLAYEVTALIHGSEAAARALGAAQSAFGVAGVPDEFVPSSKVPRGKQSQAEAVPTLVLDTTQLQQGVDMVDLLMMSGWCKSKNEARRLIVQGGVRLGERTVREPTELVREEDVEVPVLLRAGKRRVLRLQRR